MWVRRNGMWCLRGVRFLFIACRHSVWVAGRVGPQPLGNAVVGRWETMRVDVCFLLPWKTKS